VGERVFGEASGLESLELLGHGPLDDRAQVAVGKLGAQQGLEPLELVFELRARGELHLVAGGSERLDDAVRGAHSARTEFRHS
jgi:hypothetical protein